MPNSWPTGYRTFVIERLRYADIPQVAQLELRVFPEPMSRGRLQRKYRSPHTVFVAVKDRDLVIAYFGFEVCHPYAHVLANATHPDYRRLGLATFLLGSAETLARERGAKAFIGEVRLSNQPQLRVLEKIGWRVLTQIPGLFGNGETAHIVMKVFT